jgi:phosphoribosylamine--glycine ligase
VLPRRHEGRGAGLVAAGGRVLTMVARRPTLPEARAAAYEALRAVTLDGGQARSDIAFETLAAGG